MASKRFRTIFDRKVAQFVGYFSEDAESLFKDEKNNLIHPGEFGKYREEACKNIFRLILNSTVSVDDGFIITSDDDITTQCDIIIYNADTSPIITDGISKIFPAEEVRMIGEVKSTLSRKEYIEALRKLAENKRKVIDGRRGYIERKKFENGVYDTVATFLICGKLKFDYTQLDYEEIYAEIDRKYWHNAILSIENGVFYYALDFNRASEVGRAMALHRGINLEKIPSWAYPFYDIKGERLKAIQRYIDANREDRYWHIINFFACIGSLSDDLWMYRHDPIEYLGFATDSIFE